MPFASQREPAPCRPAPEIVGDPRPGTRLSASTGIRRSDSGPTYGFQWLADGRAIAGATGEHHVVSAAEVGRQLVVEVTRDGEPVAASAGVTVTKVVAELTITLDDADVSHRTRPRARLHLSAPGSQRLVGRVIVLDGGREVGRVTLADPDAGAAEVRLKRLGAGTHRLTAHYRGTDTIAAAWSPPLPVVVVRR